jgi:HEPN domain-containing protein
VTAVVDEPPGSGPGRPLDGGHWLYRLDADQWLAAAETELAHCHETLLRRAFRPAVTHARRAAGMALNAAMVREPRPGWGRSYMDHVIAVASDEAVPEEVRAAAAFLRDTPAAPPALVPLGKPDLRVMEAAGRILAWVRLALPDPTP